MSKLISIDLGNGYVKVATENKAFKFKSIYKEAKKSGAMEKGYSLNFNGIDYVVGAGNLSCTTSSSKITDTSTLLYILTAINIAFPEETKIEGLEIVLGLPSEYYKTEKDTLRKFVLDNLNTVAITVKPLNLSGTTEIEDKSKEKEEIKKIINITSCKICMQAAVYTINPKLFEDRRVLVLDVGAGTTDCVLFTNYELDDRIRTFEIGMNAFWDKLRSNLNTRKELVDKFKTKEDVEFNVVRGFFTLQRQEYKITDNKNFIYDTIQQSLREQFQEILNSIKDYYVVGALDNIILTGGAAQFLKEFFEKTLGTCEILEIESDIEIKKNEQQQYTNVLNYYNLATM